MPARRPMEPPPSPADGQALRKVMRRVPAPVAVVTAAGANETRGITISSLTSVSLDPCLVSFNIRRGSRMYGVLAAASHFAVHVLGQHQVQLSKRFATPGQTGREQFATLPHRCDRYGTPILPEALAVLRCCRHAWYDAGDHVIVLGRVLDVHIDDDHLPVLYFDRTYRGIGGRLPC